MAIEFVASTQRSANPSAPFPYISASGESEVTSAPASGTAIPAFIIVHVAVDMTAADNAGVPLVITPPDGFTLLDQRASTTSDSPTEEVVSALFYKLVTTPGIDDESYIFTFNLTVPSVQMAAAIFDLENGRGSPIDSSDPIGSVAGATDDATDTLTIGGGTADSYSALSLVFVAIQEEGSEPPEISGYTVIHNFLNIGFILAKEISDPGSVAAVEVSNDVSTAMAGHHVVINSIATVPPTTTLRVPVPGEVSAGDYAIINVVAARKQRYASGDPPTPPTHPDPVISAPAGFTTLETTAVLMDDLVDASKYMYLRYKSMTFGKFVEEGDDYYDFSLTGGDAPSLEFSHSFGWKAAALFYSGVSTSTPVADSTTYDDGGPVGGQPSIYVGPVTPSGENNMLVAFFSQINDGDDVPEGNRLKAQGSMTEREFSYIRDPDALIRFSAADEAIVSSDEVDFRAADASPVIFFLSALSGDPDDVIIIYGLFLLDATSVTVGGTPVTFGPADGELTFVVPGGAVSGFVEVITPFGSVTSTDSWG